MNGVVRTLSYVKAGLELLGDTIEIISPAGRRTVGLPSYPEIRMAFPQRRQIESEMEAFTPDAVHIATEGPIGLRARQYCLARSLEFTTSYHSRFPEYVAARLPIPAGALHGLPVRC